MAKNTAVLKQDLEALKQDLINVRKSLVDISKRARKFKAVVADKKKMSEVKNAIDQAYKNIK